MRDTTGVIFGFILLLFIGHFFDPHDHKVIASDCLHGGVKCSHFVLCNNTHRVLLSGEHRPASWADSVMYGLTPQVPLEREHESDFSGKTVKPAIDKP